MYFLVWSFLEIYIYFQAVEYLGFLQATFYYILPSFFAISLLYFYGQRFLQLQAHFQQQNHPDRMNKKLIHQAAILFACLLLLVPSLLSRLVAVVLFLPGTRHLALYFGKSWLLSKVQNASNINIRFASFGGGVRGSKENESYKERSVGPQQIVDEGGVHDVIDVVAVDVTDSHSNGGSAGDSHS